MKIFLVTKPSPEIEKNNISCLLNLNKKNYHSLVPTRKQANGRNGGENHPRSLAPTTNCDRMRLVKNMEGSHEGSVIPLENITTLRGRHNA